MLKSVKCLVLFLFMVIPTMSDAQTDYVPTDSVHHDTIFGPLTPVTVTSVPRPADSVASKPGVDINILSSIYPQRPILRKRRQDWPEDWFRKNAAALT